MMKYKSIILLTGLVSFGFCSAIAEENSQYTIGISHGYGEPICRKVLEVIQDLEEQAVGACQSTPESPVHPIAYPSLRWGAIRENLPDEIITPDWEALDLGVREDLSDALFAYAITSARIQQRGASAATWSSAFPDQEIRELVERYIEEGSLPDTYMIRENMFDIDEGITFSRATMKLFEYRQVLYQWEYTGNLKTCTPENRPDLGSVLFLEPEYPNQGKIWGSYVDFVIFEDEVYFVRARRSYLGFYRYEIGVDQVYPRTCLININTK